MIKNWNYHNLYMDYSSYTKSSDHPSDIDMFYISENNTLIVGEIKNELGKLEGGQRKLYENLIDGWKYNGIALFIIHNKYVQNGDKKVDIPNCTIREYYYKGNWYNPKKEIKVKDILDKYMKKEIKMEIVSNKEEMIFRNDYNGRPIYSIGLSKKKKDGSYENGYMTVNFKEGTDITDKTKIKIKNAWLSFYLKDKQTVPTIFISDYEIVENVKSKEDVFKDFGENIKTENKLEEIKITDADLPF